MSERIDNPSDRRTAEEVRQAENARRPQSEANVGHTPSKAEGEVRDVEEALRRQEE